VARVDYFAIESEIAAILRADPLLSGVNVVVEDQVLFAAEQTPYVGIYLDRRDAPADMQTLTAGRRTTMLLRFLLVCGAYSLDSVARAIELRDNLLGNVEVVLSRFRTINGRVRSSWLEGGEMPSGRVGDGGWLSLGEINLVAEVQLTA
jgi:hypothetical protein